jgi:peroxiredoxin
MGLRTLRVAELGGAMTLVLWTLTSAAPGLGAERERPTLNSGPQVGVLIPPFEVADSDGKPQTFESLRGPKGLLLLFTRSADWCPFCKGHLVQLERQREEFESRGYRIAALTYDSPEVLRHFAERVGITYPLLSDPDSRVIRAFDILNETVPEAHPFYGIPNPGQYLIGPEGTVEAKFFEEKYSDRFTPGSVLVRTLGGDGSAPRSESRTKYLTAITSASDAIVRGGNRISLVLEIDLRAKMHVYAPGVEGYIPIDWSMETVDGVETHPAAYPESELLHLAAIDEIVPVYNGRFRIVQDVLLGKPDDLKGLTDVNGELVLKGTFRYQACDDKLCYLPDEVPLEWRFQLEDHDRTRVPEELRRASPRR